MKKGKLPRNEAGKELFQNLQPVASTTECTGLIPAAPGSEPEMDSYTDIYDVPLDLHPQPAPKDVKEGHASKKHDRADNT